MRAWPIIRYARRDADGKTSFLYANCYMSLIYIVFIARAFYTLMAARRG